MRKTLRLGGRLAVACWLAGVASGCSWLPSPTPPNGSEQMPGASFVHITGVPALAPTRMIFSYVLPDGAVSSVTDVIEAGAPIAVDRTSQPGAHRLIVNGTQCTGTYTLTPGVITQIVVQLDGSACSVAVPNETASPAAS